MENHTVHTMLNINVQPNKVWDALTDPEKTKQYFFNCEVHSDWETGEPIVFKGKMFLIFNIELKGEILEILPGYLLKYKLQNRNDKENGESVVTIRLIDGNGATLVDVTDDVGSGEGFEKRYKRSVKGWDKILVGLKKLVE